MKKKVMFSNENTRNVFATRDFGEFNKLMLDAGCGNLAEGITKKEANDKIREVFNEILGTNELSTKKDVRKAVRRNKNSIFEVIEELVPNLLKTGWQENAFFNAFVEYKSVESGDANEFYVADDSILTVSELSGNHHDLN